MPTRKFSVLPDEQNRENLVPGEMLQASNAVKAEGISGITACRFVGVADHTVDVDEKPAT